MSRGSNPQLPVEEFASHEPGRAIGFEAGTFEDIELPPRGWAHRHTFYEIVYVSGGEATHVIDFAAYRVRPATLYFLRPGQVHFWNYEVAPSGYLIVFTDEFMRLQGAAENAVADLRRFSRLAQTPEIPLSGEEATPIRAVINDVIAEYQAAQEGYWSVLQAYLHILLTRVLRLKPTGGGREAAGRADILARQFAELLMRRAPSQQTVRAYSNALGVTPGHLAETVKQVTGRRPSELIRDAQTVEAKRLLGHTDKTVAQVAYELGFKDTAYFGRFFKREVGTTPGDFKRVARSARTANDAAPIAVRGGGQVGSAQAA